MFGDIKVNLTSEELNLIISSLSLAMPLESEPGFEEYKKLLKKLKEANNTVGPATLNRC